MSITLSLCMIVKNEEASLKNTLLSVYDIVDEIVIVDTGSTDDTIKIAKEFKKAKIFETSWEDDFSKVRNLSLSKATSDWILVLDADETVSRKDIARLKELIVPEKNVAFSFTTRNYLKLNVIPGAVSCTHEYAEEEPYSGWIPSDKIRLFPNLKDIRFEKVIHEIVEPSIIKQNIEVLSTDIPIHHFGFQRDEEFQKEKGKMHLRLLKKQLELTPENARCYFDLGFILFSQHNFAEAIKAFKQTIEKKPGFKDAYFFLGKSLHAVQEDSDAIKILEALIALDDNYIEAHYVLGNIFFNQGDIPKALHCYNRVKKDNPVHPEVFFKLGLLMQKQGNLEKAKEYMLRAKEILVK